MVNADEGFVPLYRLIEEPGKLALAVSGGSDSTALMVLAAAHAEKLGRLSDLCVLSVDHGLRDNSHADAQTVCEWAHGLGLDCDVLRWRHDGVASRVQERARKKRYQLMADWCRANGFDGLVTAHQCEDQAETVLMRLARGSGVDGLSGMAASTKVFGQQVYRPLLGVSRARLQQVLRDAGQDWMDDPANENDRFERVRVRAALAGLAQAGVEAESMALSAKRLGRARLALEAAATDFIRQSVAVYDTGYCEVDRAAFDALSDEIGLRVLDRLIRWAGGGEIAVRLAKLERLLDGVLAGEGSKHTLAGARLALRSNSLVIGREFGRIDTDLQKGVMRWDNRFCFDGPRNVQPYGLFIDTDERQRPQCLPHFVACALPVFVAGDGSISVPHLDGAKGVRVLSV